MAILIIRKRSWLGDRGLKLSTGKIELILLTWKRMPLEIDIKICDTSLTTLKVVNYLGIRLDAKQTFYTQIQQAATKTAKVTFLLSRLMAKVGGLKLCRMKILSSVKRSAVSKSAILVNSCVIPIGLQTRVKETYVESEKLFHGELYLLSVC